MTSGAGDRKAQTGRTGVAATSGKDFLDHRSSRRAQADTPRALVAQAQITLQIEQEHLPAGRRARCRAYGARPADGGGPRSGRTAPPGGPCRRSTSAGPSVAGRPHRPPQEVEELEDRGAVRVQRAVHQPRSQAGEQVLIDDLLLEVLELLRCLQPTRSTQRAHYRKSYGTPRSGDPTVRQRSQRTVRIPDGTSSLALEGANPHQPGLTPDLPLRSTVELAGLQTAIRASRSTPPQSAPAASPAKAGAPRPATRR